MKKNKIATAIVIICISFTYCDSKSDDIVIQVNANGEIQKGNYKKVVGYHGIVRYYDLNENYIGYCNFNYGLENGYMVRFLNGDTYDSIGYVNGLRDGFSYKLNLKNEVLFKLHYSKGKRIGSVYEYNSSGQVLKYSFTNFQGEILYSCDYTQTPILETGNNIAYYINEAVVNGKNLKSWLFYLIFPPHLKLDYELAVIDENKKIITSIAIPKSDCYFEKDLEILPSDYSHALIIRLYNEHKKKDDLIIKLIK